MSGEKKPRSSAAKPGKSEADPPRGLPPQSRVLAELSLKSPKGSRYRILRTSEKDATDGDGNKKGGR